MLDVAARRRVEPHAARHLHARAAAVASRRQLSAGVGLERPARGCAFNFGFTDLGAGRYLESWMPANLIFDQFALDLELAGRRARPSRTR